MSLEQGILLVGISLVAMVMALAVFIIVRVYRRAHRKQRINGQWIARTGNPFHF